MLMQKLNRYIDIPILFDIQRQSKPSFYPLFFRFFCPVESLHIEIIFALLKFSKFQIFVL